MLMLALMMKWEVLIPEEPQHHMKIRRMMTEKGTVVDKQKLVFILQEFGVVFFMSFISAEIIKRAHHIPYLDKILST